jgi:predicted N-acetyltransferase YhbS
VVDPVFQRRGVGALLVQDGIDRAHAAGLPLFVCGSSSGARLYERLGFVTKETPAITRAKIPMAMLVKDV